MPVPVSPVMISGHQMPAYRVNPLNPEDYWLWEYQKYEEKTQDKEYASILKESKMGSKKFQKKERFTDYFAEKAIELSRKLENCTNMTSLYITRSEKPARSKNSKHPEKRSNYIGVSKNGKKWQALVVIGKHKVYLGSYKTEEQAATTFDFYSLLTQLKEVKVNRDYLTVDVINMLENFKRNNNAFEIHNNSTI